MATVIEEREQVRQLARDFAEAELRPNVERWDASRSIDAETISQLAELGFFGMLVPERYGGLQFDLPTYAIVLRELAWGEPVVALLLSIHSAFAVSLLLRHGSESQKEQWLRALAAGETKGCFALSEPEAGSDAAALQTRAHRNSDRWVLHGRKKWVTNGRAAGLAVVLARTGDGSHDIGAFLVPTDVAGYTVGDRETTMGMRAAEVVTVDLEGVELGDDALLGEPGHGFAYAMEVLELGRIGIAAQAVGIATAALDHALGYAAQREQFGQAIREFEGMQFKLADMATRVEAARTLVDAVAAAPSAKGAAMAKLFASETAMKVSTQAVQVFGGYGYMRDYPVEKLMRDAKATEIYEGTNEIQRVIIARGLYRERG